MPTLVDGKVKNQFDVSSYLSKVCASCKTYQSEISKFAVIKSVVCWYLLLQIKFMNMCNLHIIKDLIQNDVLSLLLNISLLVSGSSYASSNAFTFVSSVSIFAIASCNALMAFMSNST